MPNRDQTGPRGAGPMTGRGMGKCNDNPQNFRGRGTGRCCGAPKGMGMRRQNNQ